MVPVPTDDQFRMNAPVLDDLIRADRVAGKLPFAVVATASPLLGHRASFPSWLSIEIGVAVLLFGSGLTWVAVRVFNGQRVILRVPLIGPVLWLIACQSTGSATLRLQVAGVSPIHATQPLAPSR